MPGGFAAGLSGLAGVPGGYVQGGLGWQQLQQAETDQAAQAALGKALQAFTGGYAGMTGGPPPSGSFPSLGGARLPPPPSMGGIPGPPSPGMGGGGAPGYTLPPGFVNPSRIDGQPQNLTGPVIPPGGTGGSMPGQPPMAPPGAPSPPLGAAPGGLPMQSMDWRQVAQMVAQSNPGAPPEVIAAAVTKAIPLMNSDSQQQWRMVQMQLQQERINQGGERLDLQRDVQTERERANRAREEGQTAGREERQREFDVREGRLREALDWRKDVKAQELQLKVDAARQKASSLQASQDARTRNEALKEWQASFNAYYKYMAARIQAQTQLGGAEKKQALKDLDAQWAQNEQQIQTLRESGPQTTPPAGSETPLDRGKDMLKRGMGTPTGPAPGSEPAADRKPGKYRLPDGTTGTWDGKTWTPD